MALLSRIYFESINREAKIEMSKLQLYHIHEGYIRFLHKVDHRVQFNKGERRPYVGVVLKIGDHEYYVPLESPKPNHQNIRSGGPILKLDEGRLGIMGFNNMIPVKRYQLIQFDILAEPNLQYRNLLLNQLRYCKRHKDIIYTRAKATYDKAIRGDNPFYSRVCCDFKRLELIYSTYKIRKTAQ